MNCKAFQSASSTQFELLSFFHTTGFFFSKFINNLQLYFRCCDKFAPSNILQCDSLVAWLNSIQYVCDFLPIMNSLVWSLFKISVYYSWILSPGRKWFRLLAAKNKVRLVISKYHNRLFQSYAGVVELVMKHINLCWVTFSLSPAQNFFNQTSTDIHSFWVILKVQSNWTKQLFGDSTLLEAPLNRCKG